MATARVKLIDKGIEGLLTAPGVLADLERRADAVLAATEASAPRESGAYVLSLRKWTEQHRGRVVVKVGATVDYGMAVEAHHGTLARALDSAGGQ